MKKELSAKQKNADKDLNISIFATLIPLIVYLIFGKRIKLCRNKWSKYMAEVYSCYADSIWTSWIRKFDCYLL